MALAGWGSCGDAGLLGVCGSAGVTGTGTGEGGWAGGGDAWGEGGRPAGGVGCTGSAGRLGTESKTDKTHMQHISFYYNGAYTVKRTYCHEITVPSPTLCLECSRKLLTCNTLNYMMEECVSHLKCKHACLLCTCYDSLFEELLSHVRQEADDSFPGYFPQVRESCPGVCAVEDPCCVHHQQHVLQRLRDRLQLQTQRSGSQ